VLSGSEKPNLLFQDQDLCNICVSARRVLPELIYVLLVILVCKDYFLFEVSVLVCLSMLSETSSFTPSTRAFRLGAQLCTMLAKNRKASYKVPPIAANVLESQELRRRKVPSRSSLYP
jgi:hypothetical protein